MAHIHDDILPKQLTFLEGIVIPQPCCDEEVQCIPDHEAVEEGSQVVEVTHRQLSWAVAVGLLGGFMLFLGGYHLGKLATTQGVLIPQGIYEQLVVGSSSPPKVEREMFGRYTYYEDALNRCKELKNRGKLSGIQRRTSCSLSGIERSWYQVGEPTLNE